MFRSVCANITCCFDRKAVALFLSFIMFSSWSCGNSIAEMLSQKQKLTFLVNMYNAGTEKIVGIYIVFSLVLLCVIAASGKSIAGNIIIPVMLFVYSNLNAFESDIARDLFFGADALIMSVFLFLTNLFLLILSINVFPGKLTEFKNPPVTATLIITALLLIIKTCTICYNFFS